MPMKCPVSLISPSSKSYSIESSISFFTQVTPDGIREPGTASMFPLERIWNELPVLGKLLTKRYASEGTYHHSGRHRAARDA